MPITRESFGQLPDGRPVEKFTLKSAALEAEVLSFGGILSRLKSPDRAGQMGDVTLGYDHLEPYLTNRGYLGALIGRYGNRIGKGRLVIQGQEYQLALNNGPNHLHGGSKGFDKQLWQAEPEETADGPSLILRYISPHAEENYPGRLAVEVHYTFTNAGEWRIVYTASTDQSTVVNLTQHAYFNLAGQGNILGHQLELLASQFLPVDDKLIPLGPAQSVEGTSFDFRDPIAVGARGPNQHPQSQIAGGYDHNWILDKPFGSLGLAAKLFEPGSGRVMEAFTSEPGIQFYGGNHLPNLQGRGGQVYGPHAGLCLETQHYPDSPNQLSYPSTALKPGQVYRQTTVYKFSSR